MTTAPRSPAATTAAIIRDWLPTARRESVDVLREVTQTTTWLVTLASGLLTFVAVKQPPAQWELNPSYHQLLAALVATIALGVAQRGIQLWMFRWATEQDMILFVQLAAGTTDVRTPKPVDSLDSVDEIVAEFEKFFRMDYKFLKEASAPLELAKEAYLSQRKHWEAHEARIQGQLDKVMSAYVGRSLADYKERSEAGADDERIRRRGKHIRILGNISLALFILTAASFLFAAATLALRL